MCLHVALWGPVQDSLDSFHRLNSSYLPNVPCCENRKKAGGPDGHFHTLVVPVHWHENFGQVRRARRCSTSEIRRYRNNTVVA